jgi:hypothetical protein
LFQLEVPGDGDDIVVVATVQREPTDVEEIVEGQTQANSLQDDAEADADAGKTEV